MTDRQRQKTTNKRNDKMTQKNENDNMSICRFVICRFVIRRFFRREKTSKKEHKSVGSGL